MQSRKSIDILAAVFILIALAAITLTVTPIPPAKHSSLHRSIGEALAKDAISLAGAGGQVRVIARDTGAFKQPATDILYETLQKELRKSLVKIAPPLLIQVDPLRPVSVGAGDFYEVLRKSQPGTVIVSLMGPPLLNEDQYTRLGTIKAKVVAFCPGSVADSVDFKALFEKGLLHAAIVSHPISKTASTATSATELTTFDQLYLRVTPATAGGMLADKERGSK